MQSNTITVNHHEKSSRIFATRLMLFCAGNTVDDDFTVDRIFLVYPVCSLRSAVCSLQMSYTGSKVTSIHVRSFQKIVKFLHTI